MAISILWEAYGWLRNTSSMWSEDSTLKPGPYPSGNASQSLTSEHIGN